MSDMSHSYERHNSFISEIWLILHTWDIRVNYAHIFSPLQKCPYSPQKSPYSDNRDQRRSNEWHYYTWDIRVKCTHISRTCEIYGECWIRCLKLQVSFLKRAMNYVALLRKMTYICALIGDSAFAISLTRAQWGTHISVSDKEPHGKRRMIMWGTMMLETNEC